MCRHYYGSVETMGGNKSNWKFFGVISGKTLNNTHTQNGQSRPSKYSSYLAS